MVEKVVVDKQDPSTAEGFNEIQRMLDSKGQTPQQLWDGHTEARKQFNKTRKPQLVTEDRKQQMKETLHQESSYISRPSRSYFS